MPKDGDPSMMKSAMQMDDNDFMNFFHFEDDDMNELLNDNINDKVTFNIRWFLLIIYSMQFKMTIFIVYFNL